MNKKEFDLLALGELLLRLSPPNNERIVRGEVFEKQVGGAELTNITEILTEDELGERINVSLDSNYERTIRNSYYLTETTQEGEAMNGLIYLYADGKWTLDCVSLGQNYNE